MVVVGVVLMALFMFWGAEQLERIFGGRDLSKEPTRALRRRAALVAVAAFGAASSAMPRTEDKWTRLAPTKEPALANREVQIHPGELLASIGNDTLKIVMLDVRPESRVQPVPHPRRARTCRWTISKKYIPEIWPSRRRTPSSW